MDQSLLCSVCAQLNIELLLTPTGVPYHLSVLELQKSASECRLCRLTYNEFLNSKVTPHAFRQLLRQKTYAQQIQTRVRLAEEKNLVLFETSQKTESETNTTEPLQAWKNEATVTVALQVWSLENDAALRYGLPCRRQLGRSTRSEESLMVAKGWLRDCIEQHVGRVACRFDPDKSRYGGSERPTRLIDSSRGFDDLRLVAGNAADPTYVALSYVWGVGDAPWKTVQGNLERRHAGFSIQELPQTLRDAVEVTAALGVHLCWIDALCIVQNDAEEWERESVKMDIIYSSAVVTLMASCSSSSTAGLFNEQSTTCDDFENRGVLLESTLTNGEQSVLMLSPPPQHKQWLEMALSTGTHDTVLFQRGWCFQEWILSPRKLYFSSSQLFWECTPGCLSEDGLWTYQRHRRGPTQALMGYLEAGDRSKRYWSMGMNMLWYFDLVSQSYSDRSVTNQSDRLIAISGLAKMMQLAAPSKYLAGIWEHSLPGGLCWRRISSGGKCSQYVAPSWSWASQDDMIGYMIDVLDPDNRHTVCEVRDVWVRTKGGDEMGLAVAGEITLYAPTFQADIGMMISEAGLYEVDQDPPLEHVLYPERPASETMRWSVRGLVTDSDEEIEQLAVMAIIVFDNREKEQVGIVVAERVRSEVYRRVGFVWAQMSPAQRTYLTITMKTVTIM